jgi:RNA polymerase sigma factor (sigma-70 family)
VAAPKSRAICTILPAFAQRQEPAACFVADLDSTAPQPAALPPEALLAHADFVRRLARHLIQDEHAAEDLVQDTWLSAMQRPPRDHVVRRGWLATVVTNLSRNRRRDDRLRDEREHDASVSRDADYSVPTDSVVMREATRRQVVDVVLSLEEPYRSTILLIYFEGQSATDIARRAGISSATVRSRRKRGLEQLRSSLDRRNAGDRRAWVTALAPFAESLRATAAVGSLSAAAMVLLATMTKNSTVWAIGLLLSLSAFAVWSAWPTEEPAPEPTKSAAKSGADLRAGRTQEAVGTSRESREAQRRVVQAPTSAVPSLMVRVERDGENVAGVVVFAVLVEGSIHDAIQDAESAASGKRRLGTTDELGRVRAPVDLGVEQVFFAAHGGEWGSTVLMPELVDSQKPLVIELQTDRSLDVLVVDAAGEPAGGVPVTFGPVYGPGLSAMRRQSTGADGRTLFRHVQATFTLQAVQAQLGVGLNVPLRGLVQHVFTRDTWPEAVVRLQIPAVGGVEVRMVDEAGQLWRPPATSHLFFAVSVLEIDGDRIEKPRAVRLRLGADGTLRIYPVGLGLTIRVSLPRSAFASGSLDFAGPKAPDERMHIELPVRVAPVLTGRLMSRDLAPVRDTKLWTTFFHRDGRVRKTVVTDGDGRFTIPVPGDKSEKGDEGDKGDKSDKKIELLLVDASGDRGPGASDQVTVDMTRMTVRKGINEIGDLTLRAQPIALSGKVVDAGQEPVAGARVRVVRRERGYEWGIDQLYAKTGPDGTFEIRGGAFDHGLFAQVSAQGYVDQDAVSFSFGERDRVFVVRQGASIVARLLLDDWVNQRSLLVTTREFSKQMTRGCSLAVVSRDGQLRLQNLSPGRVSIRIEAAGDATPLVDLAEILVKSGETKTLADIDLRGRVRRIRLHVVDEKGAPLPRVFGLVDPDPSRPRVRPAACSSSGVIDVLCSSKNPIITLAAPGRQRVTLRNPKDGQKVTMPLGIPVGIRATSPPLPEGIWLEIALRPVVPRVERSGRHQYLSEVNMAVSNGDLGSLAVAWVRVRGPRSKIRVGAMGPHSLLMRVFAKGGYYPVTHEGPRRVTVREGMGEVKLELTTATLQAVLRRSRG